ncbi:glycosyltransferase [Dyadobacter sp. 32]|uniref:glycosyltransferase n=1 Tax=Dyadobacter sp. 32 TaxID=538966 RepID=UPI0011EC3776
MVKSTKIKHKVAVIWGKWGPYHHERFRVLSEKYGVLNCVGIALAGKSINYQWKSVENTNNDSTFITLYPGKNQETLSPLRIAIDFYKIIRKERIEVVFLPSYWPGRSIALLIVAKLMGLKCIMMNESHAGTEKAKGIRKVIKKNIIKLFDAGLVGGTVQIEYFKSLGMSQDRLFKGYDVVNNNYYEERKIYSEENADKIRYKLGLPKKYVLNIGRMVPKKNLDVLIKAYAQLQNDISDSEESISLVLIGNGEEESKLKMVAKSLGLFVEDLIPETTPNNPKTVYFGGFRDIDDNSLIFSLSTVFVLPSLWEEWGLVVNEAMSCSVPVIVSETAGCSKDLVIPSLNGFIFDPKNSCQLSNLIVTIARNPTLQKMMGMESNKHIKDWSCELFATNAIKAIKV